MKKIIKSLIKMLAFLTGAGILSSCEYTEIRDAPWPDQMVYMPAAVYNNYTIDKVPSAIGYDPTPGYPTRFKVDTIARKFNIMLGAYRSGIDNKGSFDIAIAVNEDTINQLLPLAGKLPAGTVLLPSDMYSVPASVKMEDGSDIAKFDLSVDLDFLLSNYNAAGKTYAIAVGISTDARKVNQKFATTIIVIDTKIMKPAAGFTTAKSGAAGDVATYVFTNTSASGTIFKWNFGDGATMTTTAAKNETVKHAYAAAGTYPVTLTAIGIADYAQKSVLTTNMNVVYP